MMLLCPRVLRLVSAVALSVGTGVIVAPSVPAADASSGQVVVDATGISVDALVARLIGEGVTASNVTFTGDRRALGSFEGMSAVGLASGVALSTGSVAKGLPGPHGSIVSVDLGQPGDDDASAIAGAQTFDAAVLEFDIVPRANSLSIVYVFGSAEYEHWIGAGFDDAFGFFVDGRNCAVIDGVPVRIDTVNPNANADLYVGNTSGAVDTAMNGFTVPLSCIAPVEPGVANHVKLVIADAADADLDSSVLLAAGGFVSNSAPSAGNISFTVSGDATAAVTFPGVDADGDALTYTMTAAPTNGTFVLAGGGGTYTPTVGYSGQDAFEYVVSDGVSTSAPYRVTIEVARPAASASPVRDVRYDTVAGEDTALTLVARFADDVEYDPSTVEFDIVRPPAHGTLSGTGAHLAYRSADDYEGSDSFEYTASAIAGDVSTAPLPADSPAAGPLTVVPATADPRTADPTVAHGTGPTATATAVSPTNSPASAAATITATATAALASSPLAVTRVTSDPVTVRLDVAARPLPQTQPRTVPVFPPSPVKVDGTPSVAAEERLARTGADIAPVAGLAAVAMIAGVAFLTSRALPRRRPSGSRPIR